MAVGVKRKRSIPSAENMLHHTTPGLARPSTIHFDEPIGSILHQHTGSDPKVKIHACSPLPLSQKNLQILNGDTMSDVKTPTKSSRSTATSKPKAANVEELLYLNNLMIDDDEAFEKYDGVKKKATKIIRGRRNSDMADHSRELLDKTSKEFKKANELTFLIELWGILLHKTREVENIIDPVKKKEWVEQAWDNDQLRVNWSADFARASVPGLQYPKDKVERTVLEELLAELPRVENPKPDLAYGLKIGAFKKFERLINREYESFVQLSKQIYHLWFIVEAKAGDASILDAQPQCCRGGAAMVHARMKFNALGTQKDLPEGPDLDSIAFSLALHPLQAIMYVHWAEIEKTEIVYHMNVVNSYDFVAPDGTAFATLRHDIDNVLDWGTLNRKNEIKDVYKQIQKRMGEKKSSQGSSLSSPRKRKRADQPDVMVDDVEDDGSEDDE